MKRFHIDDLEVEEKPNSGELSLTTCELASQRPQRRVVAIEEVLQHTLLECRELKFHSHEYRLRFESVHAIAIANRSTLGSALRD